MTPETLTSLRQNLIDLENDICHLAHKKLAQPENSYRIDKFIFLHKKIKRSIMFEIERAEESTGSDQINVLVANDTIHEQ